jgi:hypothetical protein
MRSVLIVSPNFPPVNTPDQHRVRTSLPYFAKFGWQPTVLAVTAETCEGIIDPLLQESVPADVEVCRVDAWSETRCRRFGFRHLDYRCLLPLFKTGSRLLRTRRYDVVYFSTTAFNTFLFAPIWKFLYGCKIVFDFQDPWYREGLGAYTKDNVPGGPIKFRLNQLVARFGEWFSMLAADHIVSVSRGYVKSLSQRYPRLKTTNFSVIPFGASESDYEIVRRNSVRQYIFKSNDGMTHWTYVGRGGPDMEGVLTALFRVLSELRQQRPDYFPRLRIHFVGTNYAPPGRTFKVVEPIAARWGVADIVDEHSERIPYFEGLAAMAESDAVLLVGSNSGDYTASKLLNCIMSERPILALFHADSLVSEIAGQFSSVYLATFRVDPRDPGFEAQIRAGIDWLCKGSVSISVPSNVIEPYLAEELTRQQCAIFDYLVK